MHFYGICIVLAAVMAATNAQLSGSVSSNPAGGQDIKLVASKFIGKPEAHIGAGVFAGGNTQGGPVTLGEFVQAGKNGHSLTLQHLNTPGQSSTLQESLNVNLLNKNPHRLDANAFHSKTHLNSGFDFNRVGGGLDYTHAAGHGVSASFSRIPEIKMNTVDLTGKANLWKSPNKMSSFDLTGGISKNFGGGFKGPIQPNIGLGFTHHF